MDKIIIIGAGISGLAAANHLRKQGFEVKILEGRERAGGRICVDNSWGIPLARGAHWIHGAENNPMLALAQQFSSPALPFANNKYYIFSDNGQRIPKEAIANFDREFDQALVQAKNYALNAAHDCSLAKALAPFWPSEARHKFHAALSAKALNFFEGYMGECCEKLSARYWDLGGSLHEENFIVADGFSNIINGLTKFCDIEFNTCVKEIHYGSKKIELVTNRKNYTADKVIVTVPLGVLKKNVIQFNPSLPAIKQQAISAIGMGLFDIIGLRFPTAFWPKDCSFSFIDDAHEHPTCNIYVNMEPFLQKPILYGYVGGATARAMEKLSLEDVSKRVMQTLGSAFGANIPDPEAIYMTHWQADPFCYGSYSYVAVGAAVEDFMALAEPIDNKLYFAGEATNAHLYDATTHGAYLSGIREAERIVGWV